MDLPVLPPVAPMLAKSVKEIPPPDAVDGGYVYEPKWDGFRTIVFRDGDDVELGSRNTKPMTRYFPDLVEAVRAELPERCVVDGEIIRVSGGKLDFDGLQQRIHPADSRVRMLARETPVQMVVFDLLALGDDNLLTVPLEERQERLAGLGLTGPSLFFTPRTRDHATATEWFSQFEGAGLDGVVVKALRSTYQPDKRVMLKVKHERTADVVLAGYRPHKTSTPSKPLVGSLLLGLYDDAGTLQHVGVAASFTTARRAQLVEELAPLVVQGGDHPWVSGDGIEGERRPGAESRWSSGKDLSFVALRPERVLEVAYDHMEGDRFRHTTQFRRWRPDRDPASCTYDQLEEPVNYDLAELLGRGV